MKVDELEQILKNHEQRIASLEQTIKENNPLISSQSLGTKKPLSMKEFIISKDPKTDIQKTLTIAYYLEKFQGFESFNRTDLRNGFSQAKEPIPSNINVMVNNNVANGHMMQVPDKKEKQIAWMLTNTGERFVNKEFQE